MRRRRLLSGTGGDPPAAGARAEPMTAGESRQGRRQDRTGFAAAQASYGGDPAGNATRNRAPPASVLLTVIVPPWASTSPFTM